MTTPLPVELNAHKNGLLVRFSAPLPAMIPVPAKKPAPASSRAQRTALAKRLGVASWASLGAIPAAVPHTRPVPILATASADGLGTLRLASQQVEIQAATVAASARSSAGTPSSGRSPKR